MPRTGTVAYEMSVAPFLPSEIAGQSYPLVIFTFIFFAVTFYLALNPSKLVGRIGKVLTPILLAVIAIIVGKALITPLENLVHRQKRIVPLFLKDLLMDI